MKNIAIINTSDFGSIGRLSVGLHQYALKKGYYSLFCYGRGERKNNREYYRFITPFERYLHAFITRITGKQGYYSSLATRRLLNRLSLIKVDVIIVGNLHGYYINEKLLFKYVADNNIPFVYLMFDEYPLLGKCTFVEGCSEYRNGCINCKGLRRYPSSLLFNRASEIFKMKKDSYSKMKRTAFVGPKVVVDLALSSPLLKNENLITLDEAINVDFYSPKDTRVLKSELGIDESMFVCICVAPYGGNASSRKGVRYYIELARMFERNKNFVFVHVGYLAADTKNLPSNYIPIGFIDDQKKLCEFYSLGDLFVFPSLADSMPSACLCALSCGTPLLGFDISGMSDIATPDISSFVQPCDVDAMKQVVISWPRKTDRMIKRCRDYARNRYDNKVYNETIIKIAESL